MKKDIANLQASVRARLQNKAKETNRSFDEVLQYYGMERFIYRFSKSEYANKLILKGALLFTIAKEIEEFLIKPLDAIGKELEFNAEWKSSGPWIRL